MSRFTEPFYNLKHILTGYFESQKTISAIKKKHDWESLKKVRISIKDVAFHNYIKLQTSEQLAVWGDTAFVTVPDPDLDLVINKPNPFLPLSRDIEKRWLLHVEPPGYIRKLGLNSPCVLEKFARVYTCDPELYDKNWKFIASPPYGHWNLAINAHTRNPNNLVYDYDFLTSRTSIPQKEISLVTINSALNDLPGHKLRAEFISKISEDNLDYELHGSTIWNKYRQYKGRAENGKWPVYSRSKYALVIENELADYYWSEKFTDALLCFAMPVYYGCPRIGEYFPEGSYIALDITKKSAADDLRDILSSDFYERNIPALIEARNLVLTKHNMFSFIDREVSDFFNKP